MTENSQKNLFIVRYPFQLLSAYEAVNYFNLSNNLLILIINEDNPESHIKQLENVLDNDFWDDIIIYEENKNTNFFKLYNLIKKIKLNSFNHVFIKSTYHEREHLIISNINFNKLVLLEVGSVTFKIINKIKNNISLFKTTKKLYRYYFLGLKIKKSFNFEIFSMYSLEKLKNIKIHKHSFEYLKEKNNLKNKQVHKEIFIIGQQLVEKKLIYEKSYINYIGSITNKFLDYKIKYIAHRKESQRKLSILKENYPTLNILNMNKMGEQYFTELKYQPLLIIGVNSTLLFSLKNIYPNSNINAFVFKDNEVMSKPMFFEDSYKAFKKEGINLVSSEDF